MKYKLIISFNRNHFIKKMNALKTFIKSELNVSDVDLNRLLKLKYTTGAPVFRTSTSSGKTMTPDQIHRSVKDVLVEIIGIPEPRDWDLIISDLSNSIDLDDFVFKSPAFDEGRHVVAQEINTQQLEKLTVKGAGRCPGCKKEDSLVFGQQTQVGGGDEALATRVHCVNCRKTWIKR